MLDYARGLMDTSCVIPHSCFSRLNGLTDVVQHVVGVEAAWAHPDGQWTRHPFALGDAVA